jgi:hypothetical protein
MAKTRDEAREDRAAARAERVQREKPDDVQPDGAQTLKETAKVAATAAAVGAAVGAARALTRHREDEPEHEQAPPVEDRAETEPSDVAAVEPDADELGEEERAPPRPSEQPSEAPSAHAPSPDDQPQVDGVELPEARRVVATAREQFEALYGRSPETVSSLERRPEGWRITLEVVELARIPESTDVLVSYEVTLDDDERLVRYVRGRRYVRSQAGEGGEP